MIETILTKIGALILTPVVFLSTFFVQPQEAPMIEDEALGVALPSGTALFETSLASPITGSASSLTLVANSIRGGGSLSGYQCFTIDEGSAQAEYVCGTVSGTSVTSLERGLSPSDGITQTTALQFSHRRGASVKITDFPLIQRLRSQAVGTGTYETPLQYATTVATSTVGSNSQNLASVAYVNSLSFGGVAASAQEAVNGFVELATGAEAASSTATGTTNARLALSTLISTSSAPTSGNVVVVTQDDGNIDPGFLSVIATTTLQGMTYGGFYATATASSTFTGASTPQSAYLTASGTATTTQSTATSSSFFHGFAVTSASIGGTVKIQTDGIVTGFSGLTKNVRYFASDNGTVSSTPGTYTVPVGTAISDSAILISKQRKILSGSTTFTTSSVLPVYTGFRPSKVTVYASLDRGGTGLQVFSEGNWNEITGNSSIYNGDNGSPGLIIGVDSSKSWRLYSDTSPDHSHSGIVTGISNTGFELSNTISGSPATAYVYWVVEGY